MWAARAREESVIREWKVMVRENDPIEKGWNWSFVRGDAEAGEGCFTT